MTGTQFFLARTHVEASLRDGLIRNLVNKFALKHIITDLFVNKQARHDVQYLLLCASSSCPYGPAAALSCAELCQPRLMCQEHVELRNNTSSQLWQKPNVHVCKIICWELGSVGHYFIYTSS